MAVRLTPDQRDIAQREGLIGAVISIIGREGVEFETAFAKARAAKEKRRQQWLTEVIDPLAKKHGTNREVIISVLFCDDTPEGPHMEDARWAEHRSYVEQTLEEAGLVHLPVGQQF